MDNPLKYSDLIKDDGAIDKAIKDLQELNKTYDDLIASVGKKAEALAKATEKLSGATEQGREATRKAAEETERLANEDEKLKKAKAKVTEEIIRLRMERQQETRMQKLQIQYNQSEAGSYNKLSAEYGILKAKLNAMSEAQRQNTEEGKRMEKQAYEIYQAMIKLQEATGKHTLSVGNYEKGMQGLNVATAQIIRELPAAAISADMFFLAISNNIPMLQDQIQALIQQNKLLRAEGKQTISVMKALGKSLLSVNTIVMLLVTALTVFGGDLVNWVKGLFQGKKAVDALKMSTENYREALLEAHKAATKDIATLKVLYEAAMDNARAMNERVAAADELQKRYPDYFGNLEKEEILTGKGADAYAKLTRNILEYAKATAIRDKIAENMGKLVELEFAEADAQEASKRALAEKNKAEQEYSDYLEERRNTFSLQSLEEDEIYKKLRKNLLDSNKEYEKQNELLKDTKNEIDAIKTANDKLQGKISIKDLVSGGVQADGGKGGAEAKTDNLKYIRDAEDDRISIIQDARKRELAENKVTYQRKREDLQKALQEEKALTIEGRNAINESITLSYEQQKMKEAEINKKYDDKILAEQKKAAEAERKERERQLKEEIKAQQEAAKERERAYQAGLNKIDMQFDLRNSEIDLLKATEDEKTKLRLEAEKERWLKILELNKEYSGMMADEEIQTIQNIIAKINQDIAQGKGKVRDIYDLLGLRLDDEQKSALDQSLSYIADNFESIMQSRLQAIEAEVEAAKERTNAAQSAYEAELEARNNGYANNVVTTKKELELEKKKQREKEKMLEKQQKAQMAYDAAMQTTSLITASANLWKSFSGLGPLGVALALAAIGTMWASFAAAKIKAAELTTSTEAYGEGGLEFLEGGSHASGHDIHLGVRNRRKKYMRAEGGEALAIINRKNTRRYKGVLPGLIDSLNKGKFEQFISNNDMLMPTIQANKVDLSRIENDLGNIRKSHEDRVYTSGGKTVIVHKNVKRIIN